MANTLVTAGILFIAAAIIGGGIKAFKIEIQAINSLKRQIMLGILGLVLVTAGTIVAINENGNKSEAENTPQVAITYDDDSLSVGLEELPATLQAGITYPISAEITGDYDRIEFSADNGILEAGISDELAFWTPLESGKFGSLKVEVFYGDGKKASDTFTADVEKAIQPICPTGLSINQPAKNGKIEEAFEVFGKSSPLADGITLRLAMWPAETNNYHPQSIIPDSETWTLTAHAGAPGEAGKGSKFDLVILAANAVGDFYIEEYLKTAEETNNWFGISNIEGVTECLRIESLARK